MLIISCHSHSHHVPIIILTAQIINRLFSPYSLNVSTGVVVDVGEGVATCVAVVNGKEQHFLKCDPNEATSTKLAEMVHRVVTETSIEKAALAQNIVLTGNNNSWQVIADF